MHASLRGYTQMNTYIIIKKLILLGFMFKKYKFPLNLFLIFEKIEPIVYTSECITNNHYAIIIPNNWYFSFIKLIRNELFFNSSTLIEQSCVDLKNFASFNDNFNINFLKKKILFYNIFYFYFLKIRLSLFLGINNECVQSIDTIYENANWLERESSEMFGVSFVFKKDIRNLLLEYSKNEYPMLKEFPCEGYYDLYYDIFDEQLKYIESEFVEL